MQERMERLIQHSKLPEQLHKVDVKYVTPGVQSICNNIFSATGIIYLYGTGYGKSTNAAAILLSYLNGYRDCVNVENVGLYLSAFELCLHNRNRYGMDAWLTEQLELIKTCKCLVLDDMFACLTQQDDILMQAIYSMRQYFNGVTVVVTSTIDPTDCSGGSLFRFARAAKYKEEFKWL